MDLKQWLEDSAGRRDGKEWELANCKTFEDVWANARPGWLLWVATSPGVLTDKEFRLFACWSVRQVWHLLTDDRSRTAVEVSERYANGLATDGELAAALAAALDSTRAVAWDDARAAALAAARAAAWAAARASARASARAASGAAAGDAAWDAARVKQAEYLRANYKPNFN